MQIRCPSCGRYITRTCARCEAREIERVRQIEELMRPRLGKLQAALYAALALTAVMFALVVYSCWRDVAGMVVAQ